MVNHRSELGRNQAQELLDFLEKPSAIKIDDDGKQFVNGERESDTHKSILVVSNLRRAIATATYVLLPTEVQLVLATTGTGGHIHRNSLAKQAG